MGTSIQDLKNLQYEQGHNAAHHVQQAQHTPYYNIPNNYNYPQQSQNIEELARDINNDLSSDTFVENISENDEEIMLADIKNENKSKNLLPNLLPGVPMLVQDSILILIIYIILSQPLIKNTIGNYIKQIQPRTNGEVSQMGIIIYGIILVLLYALTKKFLL